MAGLIPLTDALIHEAASIHAAAMADGLGGDAWGEGSFRALLATAGTVGWIAAGLRGGAGIVLVRAMAGEAEILTIGVHPAARHQGLARALLAACYAVLPAMGAERLLLEVAIDNLPAQALYRSEGFVAVGSRPGYYRRGSALVDALVMARPL